MTEGSNGQDDRTDEPDPDLDLDLLDYLQSLTPFQRLERHDQAIVLARALWRAGRSMNGVDARPSEETS